MPSSAGQHAVAWAAKLSPTLHAAFVRGLRLHARHTRLAVSEADVASSLRQRLPSDAAECVRVTTCTWSRLHEVAVAVAGKLEPRLAASPRTAASRHAHVAVQRRGRGSRESGHHSVVLLAEPGASFSAALLGVWACGRMVVPLSHTNPEAELAYVLGDCGARTVLCTRSTQDLARRVITQVGRRDVRLVVVDAHARRNRGDKKRVLESLSLYHGELARRLRVAHRGMRPRDMDALMVYTSGTTGKPKGVVHTFASTSNQIQVLLRAWHWTPRDRVLCTLPLHHVHGLVNVTLCALTAGAETMFAFPFDAPFVHSRLAWTSKPITTFMSVPPAYSKLLQYHRSVASVERRRAFVFGTRATLRLWVSGSSALPPAVRADVEANLFDGSAKMLERYGMTEIGMALSQPYRPEAARVAGTVGNPLPTVETAFRIASSETGISDTILAHAEAVALALREPSNTVHGELLIASPSVFSRYWNNDAATRATFVVDRRTGKRWFMTGDAAELQPLVGGGGDAVHYRLVGRLSADILKVNSFKVSALDVETALLESGLIVEVAVFAKAAAAEAVSDVMVAVAVLQPGATPDAVREYATRSLAPYKRPKEWVFLAGGAVIPRNAMGKVNKKDLARKHSLGELR